MQNIPPVVGTVLQSTLVAALLIWIVTKIPFIAKLNDDAKQAAIACMALVLGMVDYEIFTYGTPELVSQVQAFYTICLSAAGIAGMFKVGSSTLHVAGLWWGNRAFDLVAKRNELKARAMPPQKLAYIPDPNMGAPLNPRPPLPEASA